eukprot:GILJ01007077.1.p1 GENE.GILJ01007077.1~~GILJ01007077.1.p1  ORF type:complete len:611 (-),score=98.66 GILJ01007077.1:144-1976(-)
MATTSAQELTPSRLPVPKKRADLKLQEAVTISKAVGQKIKTISPKNATVPVKAAPAKSRAPAQKENIPSSSLTRTTRRTTTTIAAVPAVNRSVTGKRPATAAATKSQPPAKTPRTKESIVLPVQDTVTSAVHNATMKQIAELQELITMKQKEVEELQREVDQELFTQVRECSKQMKEITTQNKALLETIKQKEQAHRSAMTTLREQVKLLQTQQQECFVSLTAGRQEQTRLQTIVQSNRETVFSIEEGIQKLKREVDTSRGLNRQRMEDIGELEAAIEVQRRDIIEKETAREAEQEIRRTLEDRIHEMRGNIRVFCRLTDGSPICPMDTDSITLSVANDRQTVSLGGGGSTSFTFDRILSSTDDSTTLCAELRPVVLSVFKGLNPVVIRVSSTAEHSADTCWFTFEPSLIGLCQQVESMTNQGWAISVSARCISVPLGSVSGSSDCSEINSSAMACEEPAFCPMRGNILAAVKELFENGQAGAAALVEPHHVLIQLQVTATQLTSPHTQFTSLLTIVDMNVESTGDSESISSLCFSLSNGKQKKMSSTSLLPLTKQLQPLLGDFKTKAALVVEIRRVESRLKGEPILQFAMKMSACEVGGEGKRKRSMIV